MVPMIRPLGPSLCGTMTAMSDSAVSPLSHDRCVAALSAEIADFATAVGDLSLVAPVSACPGWDAGKLIRHTGSVHRWAAAIVASRATERLDSRSLDMGFPNGGLDAWTTWLRDGGEALVDVLDAVDPSAPVWGFAGDGTAGFWSRRQLHETAMHRADAVLAGGSHPEFVPERAADGIDEWLMLAAGEAARREVGDLGSLHLHGAEAHGDGAHPLEWFVALDGAGISVDHRHAKGDIAVRGPVGDLFLWVAGRHTGDAVTTFGDDAQVAAWHRFLAL